MGLIRPKYSSIYDTDWKQSVRAATTADVGNLVLGNTQPNIVDGVTLSTNDRILVKNQSTGSQNGIYIVRSTGTGSNGWWLRSPDSNQSSYVTNGLTVDVGGGTTQGTSTWKLATDDPIVLDTTTLTFVQVYSTSNPNPYSNVQVGAYLTTYSGPIQASNVQTTTANIQASTSSADTATGALRVNGGVGVAGNINAGVAGAIGGAFHKFVGNIEQTSSGGAVYINTTGNIIANTGSFYAATLSSSPPSTDFNGSVPTTEWVRNYGGFQNLTVYTNATLAFSNTSATVPAGITKIKVTTIGGGGAGGGNPATVGVAGAGGGAGGICISYFAVSSGAQYWANVGAGGVGVVTAKGGTGNISTFTLSGTLYHQATGGEGGNLGVASQNVVGGFGGTASGGNINLTGSAGGAANYFSATAGQSSSGGGAPGFQGYGAGTSVRTAGAGNAPGAAGATGTGAGGSGSVGGAATATTGIGGNGGGGIIIIEY